MEPQFTPAAQEYHDKLFPDGMGRLRERDPELAERFNNFAFDTVVNNDDMNDVTRLMCTLATLMGCGAVDVFKAMVPAAMNVGVSAVQIREIVYQGVDYLGMGRVFPFVNAMNSALSAQGISLPLKDQATTTAQTRLEEGVRAQVEIFGPAMQTFHESGNPEYPHINKWLAENCFGDYYTRTGLTLAEREMVTFCYLAAQGGCEPQLTSHAKGNMNVGNSKEFLICVVSQNLPYIGYPRSLNALSCIQAACE